MSFIKRICFFIVVAFLVMPEAAYSWGPGHDDIMRASLGSSVKLSLVWSVTDNSVTTLALGPY